jgi:hypothetical protein
MDRQPAGSLILDAIPAPVAATERVEVMDVLRGVALLGVFLANMIGFAHTGVMATETQLEALPTSFRTLPIWWRRRFPRPVTSLRWWCGSMRSTGAAFSRRSPASAAWR